MTLHTFAFDPPRWHPPQRLRGDTGVLFLGSAVWLLLYGWLGYRLWTQGPTRGLSLNLLLTGVCVTLGVIMVLRWRNVGGRWQSRIQMLFGGAGWRTLNLEQLNQLTPSEFEAYVAQHIFERQGYTVLNVRDTKDGGIDVLITDAQGQQAVVQCKRYRQNVGEPIVRDLYGTMIHAGATHAFLITTAGFTTEARRWAMGKPITLIDGLQLVKWAGSEPIT
jgi:restriction system protein